jgi:hypothetical protein
VDLFSDTYHHAHTHTHAQTHTHTHTRTPIELCAGSCELRNAVGHARGLALELVGNLRE